VERRDDVVVLFPGPVVTGARDALRSSRTSYGPGMRKAFAGREPDAFSSGWSAIRE